MIALYQRPFRSDELYHYGRKGMKWYQSIYGSVKGTKNYVKSKIEEKTKDINSEDYYRDLARKGKLRLDQREYFCDHVYKLPDYSNLNKNEKAKAEITYMKKSSDDIAKSKKGDDLMLNYLGFSRKLEKVANWYEQKTDDPDFKVAFKKSKDLWDDYKKGIRPSKEHDDYDDEISGLYLRKIGFEDTPESRKAIEEYWKID